VIVVKSYFPLQHFGREHGDVCDVSVIQQYYGHLGPDMAANELTQMSLADRDWIRKALKGQEG